MIGRCHQGHFHLSVKQYDARLIIFNCRNKVTKTRPFCFEKVCVSEEQFEHSSLLSNLTFECPGINSNNQESHDNNAEQPVTSLNNEIAKSEESFLQVPSIYQTIFPLLENSFLDRQYGEINDSLVSTLKTRIDELENEISNLKTSHSQIINCECNAKADLTKHQLHDRIEQQRNEFVRFTENRLHQFMEQFDEKFSKHIGILDNLAKLIEKQNSKIDAPDRQDIDEKFEMISLQEVTCTSSNHQNCVKKFEIAPFQERVRLLEMKFAIYELQNLNLRDYNRNSFSRCLSELSEQMSLFGLKY